MTYTRFVGAAVAAALTLPLLGAPPEDLQATLDEMEAAVLAGDPAAYLRHVSPTDPVFYQEQANWAADLKLHVPTAFTLEIIEPQSLEPAASTDNEPDERADSPRSDIREPVYTDTRAIVELRTTWTLGPETTGGDPIERTISFPAVFEKADLSDAGESAGRWLYAGEEWIVIDDGENRVMCPAGFESVAEQVAAELPEVREHVDQLFGRPIEHLQEVKIYPSVLHLQHSIYLSYLDGLGGWNEPGESIKILARPSRRQRSLKPLLAHEYGHVATFELGDNATNMPWWILEGVAEFSGAAFANFRERSDQFVRHHHTEGALADWPDLADFRNINPEFTGHVYRQGHHMIEFIAERHTRAKLIDWLDRMADGATLEEATLAALNEPFEALDTAWRTHVASLASTEAIDQRE